MPYFLKGSPLLRVARIFSWCRQNGLSMSRVGLCTNVSFLRRKRYRQNLILANPPKCRATCRDIESGTMCLYVERHGGGPRPDSAICTNYHTDTGVAKKEMHFDTDQNWYIAMRTSIRDILLGISRRHQNGGQLSANILKCRATSRDIGFPQNAQMSKHMARHLCRGQA